MIKTYFRAIINIFGICLCEKNYITQKVYLLITAPRAAANCACPISNIYFSW